MLLASMENEYKATKIMVEKATTSGDAEEDDSDGDDI